MKPRSANDQHESRAFALAASIVLRGLFTEWCADDVVGMLTAELIDLAEDEKDPAKSKRLNDLVTYLDARPLVEIENP